MNIKEQDEYRGTVEKDEDSIKADEREICRSFTIYSM